MRASRMQAREKVDYNQTIVLWYHFGRMLEIGHRAESLLRRRDTKRDSG
jgi:hypothetical protein